MTRIDPAYRDPTTEHNYARELAEEWRGVLVQSLTELNAADQLQLNRLINALVRIWPLFCLSPLFLSDGGWRAQVPLVVEAMSALMQAVAQEEQRAAAHAALARTNPSLKPFAPLNPVQWLASYLMQHNPKFAVCTCDRVCFT